jgi:asparagine synthetase B (glutamine-hydrolysing)
MRGITVLGNCDPVLGWDGEQIYGARDLAQGPLPPAHLDGAAAAVLPLPDGGARIVRDRMGLGKLFWAQGAEGRIDFAARPALLTGAGHALDAVQAVPRGTALEFDQNGRLIHENRFEPPQAINIPVVPVPEAAAHIRQALDSYLAVVAERFRDRRAYVCLSGGLDSSTIAVLARRHFHHLTGVSFDLDKPGSAPSEDRRAAVRLAKDLSIPLLEATVSVDRLLAWLDMVLVEGIDWRDFNVHCALVNAALAELIAEQRQPEDQAPLVITGDLPNEFLVDYHAETYRGGTYYALPRLGRSRLRSILIDGLDTCHREGGPFAASGLITVQPYSACLEAYLSLPADFLEQSDRKDALVREIVGNSLPSYIYARPKVRAQIGGRNGGVLAACVDCGIDRDWLRSRFAALHNVDDLAALDRFLRAGRYRSRQPDPVDEADVYA